MRHFYQRFLLPVGLLAGAIIGAGIFALPYIFDRAGIAAGFFYLAVGGSLYALLHLLYADVILRTSGEHRFVGYTRIYLGLSAGRIATLMTIMGMVFTLTVYLVLSVSFLNLLFAGAPLTKVVLFWIIASAAAFLNIRKLVFSEFVVTLAKLCIVALLFALGIYAFIEKPASLNLPTDFHTLFFPIAPILFAMSGRVAIPALVKYFRVSRDARDYTAMRRAITWGTMLPVFVYALFIFGVLGLSGEVSEDAVAGLTYSLSPAILMLVGSLGLLSLWGSYIAVGADAIASLAYDFKMPRVVRSALVVGLPLLLYGSGFTNFFNLVGFVGGVFLGLEGIFILLMWMRSRASGGDTLLKKVHPLAIASGFLLLTAALVYESVVFFL